MNKKVSKVLSVMCGATAFVGMFGINARATDGEDQGKVVCRPLSRERGDSIESEPWIGSDDQPQSRGNSPAPGEEVPVYTSEAVKSEKSDRYEFLRSYSVETEAWVGSDDQPQSRGNSPAPEEKIPELEEVPVYTPEARRLRDLDRPDSAEIPEPEDLDRPASHGITDIFGYIQFSCERALHRVFLGTGMEFKSQEYGMSRKLEEILAFMENHRYVLSHNEKYDVLYGYIKSVLNDIKAYEEDGRVSFEHEARIQRESKSFEERFYSARG